MNRKMPTTSQLKQYKLLMQLMDKANRWAETTKGKQRIAATNLIRKLKVHLEK